MRLYLLQYHDEHGGLDLQSIRETPEAAQKDFPEHAKKRGVGVKEATRYFSIEIWDTDTGYVEDLQIKL